MKVWDWNGGRLRWGATPITRLNSQRMGGRAFTQLARPATGRTQRDTVAISPNSRLRGETPCSAW